MATHNAHRLRTAMVVTLISSSVNCLLALFKIVVGYVGQSQALIADGLHSFSDLITDGLVLFAARMGAQSPDKEHPYGHRRIETIGSLVIAIVLILVGLSITYDTIHHLFHHADIRKPAFSVVIVAIISVLANEGLFRYMLSQGNKINSNLLRTNAWHNRSDALVSIVVLVSVIGSMLGIFFLDSIGALIIAGLILKMGIKMIMNNIKELIDTGVDEKTLEEIDDMISKTPGVIAIHQLRTRSHSGNIFVDVHIQVSPKISVSEGHFISEQVHSTLIKAIPEIEDVTVHIDPEDDREYMVSVDLPNRDVVVAKLKQAWANLPGYDNIQRIVLHYLKSKIHVDVYLSGEIADKKNLDRLYNESVKSITYLEAVTLYLI